MSQFNFDPKEVSKMMMQGYAFNSMPFEDMVFVKGKVALVTGGTSGLGFCVSKRLLEGGANVVVASYSEAEAEQAMPLFAQIGFGEDRVKFFKADITNEENVEEMVKFTTDTFGSLDILVACAGVWNYAHIEDLPEQDFMRVINVNVKGTFLCVKQVSKYMIEKGVKGKMVLISSDCHTMPWFPFGGYVHYASSKGAIVAMATETARELKRYGIMVNSVAPGGMGTPGGINPDNMMVHSLSDEKKAIFAKEMMLHQQDEPLDTDSVARAVYMMCTPMADNITGEVIYASKGTIHGIVARWVANEEYPPKEEA